MQQLIMTAKEALDITKANRKAVIEQTENLTRESLLKIDAVATRVNLESVRITVRWGGRK